MVRTASLAALVALGCSVLGGCAAPAEDDSASSESGIEAYAQDLWAGQVSYTMERYSSDPCNNGANHLDNQPIGYGEWERQRAGVRNICFEVWKPGVTDRENPDFWRLLDVQVHYHFKGTTEWKTAYVPALDRRGNNRRYVWSLSYDMDPLGGYNVADAKAPFEIASETATSALVKSDMEFYFTINGNYLSTSTNQNFHVAYEGQIEKPSVGAGTGVLYPDVACTGLKVGSGAGFFSADITDEAAIDQFLAGDPILAAHVAVNGTAPNRTLSVYFGSLNNTPAGQLPNYSEGFGAAWHAQTRDAGNGTMAVDVKVYDRAQGKVVTRSATFASCAKQPQNP